MSGSVEARIGGLCPSRRGRGLWKNANVRLVLGANRPRLWNRSPITVPDQCRIVGDDASSGRPPSTSAGDFEIPVLER
jgi:hypothetical protein